MGVFHKITCPLREKHQLSIFIIQQNGREKEITEWLSEVGIEPFTAQTDEEKTGKSSFDFEKKTVTLNSGYEIPLNGIGTYSLVDDACIKSVSEALKRGVRLIDTAYMYHNEEEVGKAVRESGIPREEIFVTTKLYPNQFADAENAIDEAIEKLNIDILTSCCSIIPERMTSRHTRQWRRQ